MSSRILIVDDEPSIRKVLSAQLKRLGHVVYSCKDGAVAIEKLRRSLVDLVITDLRMPNVDGMELLNHVSVNYPGLPVVIITAHGTVDSAVEAIKEGAFDYVSKPFDQGELRDIVHKAIATGSANSHHQLPIVGSKYGMVGSSEPMQEIYGLIEKVAPSPTTVLITGESGTGKELVARALHEHSNRSDGPFIEINCGAIPENLFEAELFGHEKGAFTGAVNAKQGRFELANGGTLFLDEVGELPRAMQVKILRAVQERTIDRVGGVRTLPVDVRLIAATNVKLIDAVDKGTFREDLYYRLNVIPIEVPPLRDRAGDISLLVTHFIEKFNRHLGKSVDGVSDAALAAICGAEWKGNIRELENLMERAVLLTDAKEIDIGDLFGLSSEGAPPPMFETSLDEEDLKSYVKGHTARLERARIGEGLKVERGNVTRTAILLGISRKSLQLKIRDYDIRIEEYRD
jgi:two-component system response regulator AtoC